VKLFSPQGSYGSARNRGYTRRPNGPLLPRRGTPLQFALTGILVGSLLLLAMAAITRYAVGEPILPPWLGTALHHPAPTLPPGMTYDFELLNPDSKLPIEALPEVGTVEMRLAVTNDSALPMKMKFRSSKQTEFIVRRVFTYVDGLFALPLEVWRSSYFHNLSSRPSELLLQPGQTKVYSATFYLNALNARELPAGDYRVVAIFDGWQTSIPIPKPQ
jgi:Intracellular proteinase inhibitor